MWVAVEDWCLRPTRRTTHRHVGRSTTAHLSSMRWRSLVGVSMHASMITRCITQGWRYGPVTTTSTKSSGIHVWRPRPLHVTLAAQTGQGSVVRPLKRRLRRVCHGQGAATMCLGRVPCNGYQWRRARNIHYRRRQCVSDILRHVVLSRNARSSRAGRLPVLVVS